MCNFKPVFHEFCGVASTCMSTIGLTTEVIVQQVNDAQLTPIYALMQRVTCDEGVGFDVFDSQDTFTKDLREHYNYIIARKSDRKNMASVILKRSRFYRGVKTADLIIVVEPEFRGFGIPITEYCIRLSEIQAVRNGFVGVYVDTFEENEALVRVFKKLGYSQVARLPGDKSDKTFVMSKLYFKNLASITMERQRV